MTRGPVLILGARSDIGRAVAHRFAAEGRDILLAARGAETLERDCADIALRHGVSARALEYDALAEDAREALAVTLDPLPEIVVSAVGLLGDQTAEERDLAAAARVMRSNYEGPALTLAAFANRMEACGSGVLVGISSVAGDRGRASNYVYGSAKAGFTAFLSGLRNRLAGKGVRVITVKPGFVATRMTEGMDLPGPLTAEPEEVADAIARAVARGRDVVYVRPVWRLIMFVIRAIPERVFKRLSI